MTELELYHHGVKGMRWGVRKRVEETGGTRSGTSGNDSERSAFKNVNRNSVTAAASLASAYGAAATGMYLQKRGNHKAATVAYAASIGATAVSTVFGIKNESNKYKHLQSTGYKPINRNSVTSAASIASAYGATAVAGYLQKRGNQKAANVAYAAGLGAAAVGMVFGVKDQVDRNKRLRGKK